MTLDWTWTKSLILLALAVFACYASQAADTSLYTKSRPHETLSKLEATRALITNPNETVYKCSQIELTDKVTLRNKRATKAR